MREAHAVKGASANLALEQLTKVCAELEQAARQQQAERCQDLLTVFRRYALPAAYLNVHCPIFVE